jgi:arylsulfatase A-like enzyme
MFRRVHFLVVFAVALGLLSQAGCSRKQEAPPAARAGKPSRQEESRERKSAKPATGPNIILLTIDTLRADHLSCYGYRRNTSPFIDKLAGEGFVFQNAYSTAPWTAPSMASIFTALYPREHGVMHGHVAGGEIAEQEALSPDLITLPVALKKAGYRTYGITANGHLSKSKGFARGFDFFSLDWFEKCPVPHITATRLKGELALPGAFFLWIHYFDPHAPYNAREPWIRTYAGDMEECNRWAGVQVRELRSRISEIRKNAPAGPALADLYDSEINYVDQYVQKLFEEVLPPGDNSIVVVTSDHGEEFLEHNYIGHGQTLYEEVVHVPLIIRVPGGRGAPMAIDRPVSNKDIFPTVLDLAGVHIADRIPGTSLAPWMTRGSAADYGPVYLELDRGRNWKGVRSGDWKFFCKGQNSGKCSLFNLVEDPGETVNMEKQNTSVADKLHALLKNWIQSKPAARAPTSRQKLDRDQVEKLRSLGYLK